MAAPKGNRFWEARSSHGRKPRFATPEILWDACVEYFQWVDDHPLNAAELVKFQGRSKVAYVPKMRAMTIEGLCLFLDITVGSWKDYRDREDYFMVVSQVENIIRNQKLEGAAADLLNSNIIARLLGLSEKVEASHKVQLADKLTDDEREAIRRAAQSVAKFIATGESGVE